MLSPPTLFNPNEQKHDNLLDDVDDDDDGDDDNDDDEDDDESLLNRGNTHGRITSM